MRGLIDPSKIVSSSREGINPQSFSRFLTGPRAESSSSPVGSASNNIVNFSRPEVKPATPNFSSIINNISTKINNTSSEIFSNAQKQIQITNQKVFQNVNNTIENIIKNFKTESKTIITNAIQNITREYQQGIKAKEGVQGNIVKTIQNLIQTFQQKVKEKEESQPSNALKNFQTLYKSTIDFVTFLGDSKTNNKISKSLISLRKMFEDAINTSILIREAIIKIVDQLSNLPNASPNAGDLSLDIDVPGGALKQSGTSSIGQFARSPMGRRIGMGALGLGVGAGAVATGSLAAKQFQEEKLKSESKAEPSSQMIPDSFIENFGSLINKFGDSVHNLIEFIKNQSEATPSSSSGGGGGVPSPTEDGGTLPGDAPPEIKAMLEAISGGEGSWDSVNPGITVPGLSNMTIAEARAAATSKGWSMGGSGAMGKWQQLPEYDGVNTIKQRAEAAGLNYTTDKFSPENQTKIARTLLASVYPGGEAQLVKDLRTDPLEASRKLIGTWPSLPGGTQQNTSVQEFLSRYNSALQRNRSPQSQLQTSSPVGIASTSRASANATSSSTQQPISASVAQTNPVSNITGSITPAPTTQQANLNTNSGGNQASIVALNVPTPPPIALPSGDSRTLVSTPVEGQQNTQEVSGILSSNRSNQYLYVGILNYGINTISV